jgi:hypothetical protein
MINYFAVSYVIVGIYLVCRGPLVLSRKHHVESGLDLFPISPLFCILMLLSSSDVEKRFTVALVLQMIFIRKISILENDCTTAW